MNIRAKCPIISVRSASPVGSLSYQVKTRMRRQSPGVPFPSAGVLGCFFGRRGDPGIFAEPLWCGLVFFLFFWWIFPSAQTAMETSLWSVIATAFLFCSVSSFPPTFSPLIYRFSSVLSWRKDSGLFSMFLHLCLHEPLRMRWVHLCWVQRFRPSFRSTFMVILFCPSYLTIFFSPEVEHLPSL